VKNGLKCSEKAKVEHLLLLQHAFSARNALGVLL